MLTNNKLLSDSTITDIYIQKITTQDVTKTYVNWLNDPKVNKYLETRFELQTLESIRDFVEKTINHANEHLFTIRLTKNDQHIGNIKLGGIIAQHNIADISLFIGERNAWGKGYASQAINLITQYGFETLSLRKLCAGAYETNKGSTNAFLKAGYIYECTLKDHYLLNGKPCNLIKVCKFNENDEQQ